MKTIIKMTMIVACALLMSSVATQAVNVVDQLVIGEQGDGSNATLFATLNGNPVTLGIVTFVANPGSTENWVATLPTGYSWNANSPNGGNTVFLGEPENPNFVNQVSGFNNGFSFNGTNNLAGFSWTSDINTGNPSNPPRANPQVYTVAGVDPNGNGFTVTFCDGTGCPGGTTSVPDGGSTVALLGLSLGLFGVLGRWRKVLA